MGKAKVNRYPSILCLILLTVLLVGFAAAATAADDAVCARVKIEINQELTLERQAFDAHLRINNGLSHITLENTRVDVIFTDADGNRISASSVAIIDPPQPSAKAVLEACSMIL